MAEYIEREKVLSKATPLAGCFSNMISAYDVIMIPAADVAPVRHGKWIKRKSWDFHVCSECSFEKSPSNYCPNCGAKMDGGSD